MSLWSDVVSWDNVLKSYGETLKGKPKHNTQCVNFRRNETSNLKQLQNSVISGEYLHRPHHLFEIYEPKHRIIHAPQYPDKIVHHMLYQVLREVFEPRFIHDSYSCIRGKGNQRAVKQIQYFMRSVKEQEGEVWLYKLDVSKFFPSINHNILKSILRKHLKDECVLDLCDKIIDGSPNKNGIPLGSVTSQLFANIYLNSLDHYMKRKVKCKKYLRYADDIFIICGSKSEAKRCGDSCSDYLKSRLELSCSKSKQYIQNSTSRGVDGLGYKIFTTHILIKSSAKKRVRKSIKSNISLLYQNRVKIEEVNLSLSSWMSYASLANSYSFLMSLTKRWQLLCYDNTLHMKPKENLNMIYFDTNSNQYKFHALYASFLDSHRRQVKPTSDRSYWEKMVGKWGHLEDLSFTPITPSTEQQSRLDVINNTPESLNGMYSYDVGMYVQYNGVSKDNEAPFLEQFRTQDTEDNFLSAIKEDVKDDVRHYRWVKEVSGVEHNNMFVRTDSASQARIGNLTSSLLADESIQYIDFEIQRGEWIQIDRNTANDIAKAVSNHVQQCFSKCKDIHEAVDKMTYEELESFNIQASW